MDILKLLDNAGKIDHDRAFVLCKEKVDKNVSYGKFIQLIEIQRKLGNK